MTSDEITKFPDELKKSLGDNYRLLLFEQRSTSAWSLPAGRCCTS